MGSVSLSQAVDYEGYSSEYAYGTASWDENGNVTINLTSSNVLTWRIRGRNPDTKEYLVVTGGGRTGTFKAEDGKSYAFQIYSQTYSKYSDGQVFTVDFDDDSGGGDSGGGDSGGSSDDFFHIRIEKGEGIKSLNVERTWSNHGDYGVYLSNGDKMWLQDSIRVTVEPLEGYEIDTYTINGIDTNFYSENLYYSNPDINTWSPVYAEDVYVYASATATSTVYIYDGTDFNPYLCLIYNGSDWNLYTPFIYDGSNWNRYT